MARKARIKSSTGIYHVLIRAIANLPLFTDEEDYQIYTGILNDLQQQGRCEVYAYALFPTHVHLLVREGCNDTASCLRYEQGSTIQAEPYDNSHRNEVHRSETYRSEANRNEVHRSASESSSLTEPIGSIMKRLAASYSYFFNVKYDHYGPIYLDRFKSNPVETRDYFLRVLDHIGSQQSDCKYTCHHIPSGLPKGDPIINSQLSILNYSQRPLRITDSRLLAFLQQNYSFTNIGEFLQREAEEQKEVISSCKKIGGSIRQIVRLTGSPYQAVFQVK